jgi:hypothetical protein
MFLFQSIGFEGDYTDRWHFIWHANVISTWFSFENSWIVIYDVESTFAQMTWITHVECIKLCPFGMPMKCPFNTNMDVKWTSMTSPLGKCIWHPCWCWMDSCDVHLTFTWMSNGLLWQVHLVSPFDIHVDVEWTHVMSIWHSHWCQMDFYDKSIW